MEKHTLTKQTITDMQHSTHNYLQEHTKPHTPHQTPTNTTPAPLPNKSQ